MRSMYATNRRCSCCEKVEIFVVSFVVEKVPFGIEVFVGGAVFIE